MTKKLNIVGCTGHRNLKHPTNKIKEATRRRLHDLEVDVVVTGMALGFDLLVAEVCVEEDIPFIAAIPCRGQTKSWPRGEKKRYMELVEKAYKHAIISPGPFQIWKLFKRNEWIVNRSTLLIAYWDGIPKGGSYHCYEYAGKQKTPRENIFSLCE